jgi:site-specific DNA-methyltransferase (adenine-specific)
LRELPDNSVDSVVTDPPYGLSFMGKRWDYDVPAVDVWAECLRVLKPGGHLLAFAGTRTQHRMAVRIEDAGFEIRDMIAWVYGSGFPKSLDVSKAIDKAAGAERETVGPNEWAERGGLVQANTYGAPSRPDATAPATEAAKQWDGWGTALKPALEPITVARKPLVGTVAENVQQHGTGALNVDGCRVGTEDMSCQFDRDWKQDGTFGNGKRASQGKQPPPGRWPANLIHDGSEEVVELFPQLGNSGKHVGKSRDEKGDMGGYSGGWRKDTRDIGYSDSGSAARFFYCAKASKADRDEGCEGLEQHEAADFDHRPSGDFAERMNRIRPEVKRRNHHPTVKPTALMRYLCRLVTPPGGVVLDPFMGSGSTGKAAIAEGFRFIGCEREAEYVEIARARIAAAEKKAA